MLERCKPLQLVARTAVIAFSVLFLTQQPAVAHDSSFQPGIPGVQGGVVTTTEPLATQADTKMLRAGGNAINAAAAISFALNVVEPQSSGIGVLMIGSFAAASHSCIVREGLTSNT